jgi:tRNA U34 5-methylaminomethyl-2-thiouridine-forming methyltransferase MnmC
LNQLNYGQLLNDKKLFEEIHEASWEISVHLTENFVIYKTQQKLEEVILDFRKYDVVFFDAFAPKKQPELWNKTIFKKLFESLKTNGILTTYSAAGQLKRDLKSVGFELEHPPGANGKREMTVAMKK